MKWNERRKNSAQNRNKKSDIKKQKKSILLVNDLYIYI